MAFHFDLKLSERLQVYHAWQKIVATIRLRLPLRNPMQGLPALQECYTGGFGAGQRQTVS
jgi:hypothetical protein